MNTFIRRSQWILLSLFVFLVLAVSVDAQIGGSPARRVARMSDAQAGSCTTAKKGQIYFSTDSNGLFYCDGTNWVATGGGAGDALTTNPLSQFAATTSAQFAGVISDETGTGAVVLASGPTLTSPVIGTKVNLPRVTALPGTPSAGDTVIVTDDSAAGACDSGAGSAQSLCQYNGSAWVSLGDGSGSASAAGSDTQLQRNNAGSFGGISGATSDGTNVTFGSGNLRATRFRSTTSIDDANGNEVIITPATTSAVNEITITNSATGNPVSIAATGGDTNVDLSLAGKGTGVVKIGGTATGIVGLLDTDQSHYLNITPGSNLTADRTLTFTTGDAARTVTINGDVTLPAGTALVSGGALGTPSSGTGTNLTGIPISTGISGLGTGVATFLATPSSANLASAVTGETGTGALVFGTSPDFTTGATIGSVAIPTISSTSTFTNKTIDVEATGNAITTVDLVEFTSAGANAGTAAPILNVPATGGPASSVIAGTNVLFATLDFDSATDESVQGSFRLPTGWTGNVDLDVEAYANETGTNVARLSIQTICVGSAETWDPAWNTAQTFNWTNTGTNQRVVATQSAVTTTGCAAGERFFFRFMRDGDGTSGTDSLGVDLRLVSLRFTVRRTQ